MGTFLFDKIIFGPIQSRRLGVSLGVNLLPINKKICTFDCIYCECGFNAENSSLKTIMPSRYEVKTELENTLIEMKEKGMAPNVITFAGNGEPTIHKDFEVIIDDTINLRNKYFPKARIAVLSNATLIHKETIVASLKKIDDNILKLDSGLIETIQKLDQPVANFSIEKLVNNLLKFQGNLIIQTMFVQGVFNDQIIDNTTNEDIESWIALLKKISPQKVMIYTIDRETPAKGLSKVPIEKLNNIAYKVEKLGIKTLVSG